MHFGNPQLLWLLLLWPVLAALGWLAFRWRVRVSKRIGDPALLSRLYSPAIQRWRRRRMLAILAAILLLMIAAARPQYGQLEQTVTNVGTNVVVALDCSPSMDATDVAPSRLAEAKAGVNWLLRRLPGARVGVVAFSGDAVLNCPMTQDHELAMKIVESIDTEMIAAAGTDLGRAIRTGVNAFERAEAEGGRALVLLTDGEDHEGQVMEAAREAAAANVRIFAVGVGTARGAPLQKEEGGFVETPEGVKVNTQLRMDVLERVSELTGGDAIEAGDAVAAAMDRIMREIDRMEKALLEEQRQVVYQDRFQWFLAPGLALLAWALLSVPVSRTGRAEAEAVDADKVGRAARAS